MSPPINSQANICHSGRPVGIHQTNGIVSPVRMAPTTVNGLRRHQPDVS